MVAESGGSYLGLKEQVSINSACSKAPYILVEMFVNMLGLTSKS